MTIASETAKSGPYTGDGANTSFAYGFKILAKGDLEVTHYDTVTSVETVLTVDVDYTVNNVGSATGTIDYPISGSPLPATETLTLTRAMTFTQEVDLENQGGYYPEVVEEVFDRIEMKLQELGEETDRAVKVQVSQTTDPQDLIDTLNTNAALAVASASAAATSESNAATSETNAAASASAASTSETNAGTSETNAAASASAASTSATNAGTSETNAAASASAASTSASNASTSETNAATSASNAATSETNAAASETNAAASYDSFDDRYLGAKASAPTLDNDGDALLTGALYWNTTTGVMNVYNGAAWEQISGPYEPIDADILRADTTDNLSVGYTCDLETLGSDTITADFQTEGLKSRAVVGNVTLNVPTTGNGVAHIKLAADGSGPYTVTLGSGVTAVGTIPDLAASTTYIATIMRFATNDAYVQISEAG